MTNKQRALELLEIVNESFSDETFVAPGYAYHEEMAKSVEVALDGAEARGRKAEKKEIADTIQEMSNQTTFVLHCDGFTLAELIRNSPLGNLPQEKDKE